VDVAVCVKQIPSPDSPGALDPDTYNLVRAGGLVLDDSDTYSVEMALRLAEQSGGGEVTLVSMVPGGETAGLRTALAMGAARAVLVSDAALAGSDALATAKVLAAAVRRTGARLVLAATESTDGYTGTVPVQLAELLGYPSVSFAKHVELVGREGGGTGPGDVGPGDLGPGDLELRVHRQTEAGFDEVTCPLPAVVTVTAGVVEVRYPTVKGIMGARSKPIEQLDLADLGIDSSLTGAVGARQQVLSVRPVEARQAGEVIVDQGDAHERIVAALASWKVI